MCEVPNTAHFFHTVVLLMPSPTSTLTVANAAEILRNIGDTMGHSMKRLAR